MSLRATTSADHRGRDGETTRHWPCAATSPEGVFLAWVLGLSDDEDARQAARREVARLDRRISAGAFDPRILRLRELMLEVAVGLG